MIQITTQVLQNIGLEQTNNESAESIASCPHCGSANVYGMSRVVGYFSKINNWNGSKQAEFKARQKGDYAIGQKCPC